MALQEFRGVWVATVANIDWPSKPGLLSSQQQQEVTDILDIVMKLNMNAVFLQIRPQCDAFYESSIEPWSYFLTGKAGRPTDPVYDPLEFWIEESHKRGIQLHAWFNPFRAYAPNKGGISELSIVKKQPQYVEKLPKDYYWLNPTITAVHDYSASVVEDVIRRYNIDGVHFDDYFYPYGDGNFNDDVQWAEYQQDDGSLSRNEWRRENVDKFVIRIGEMIKDVNSSMAFSISPFGVWRPQHPAGITAGIDQYDQLYADAKKWLNEGWVDFMLPQLYWPIAQIPQSFAILNNWWNEQNNANKYVWPGLYTSREVNKEGGIVEIINQIMIARAAGVAGHCHFSMQALMKNKDDIQNKLLSGPYKYKAVIPQLVQR